MPEIYIQLVCVSQCKQATYKNVNNFISLYTRDKLMCLQVKSEHKRE